jgi:hypothetical protein
LLLGKGKVKAVRQGAAARCSGSARTLCVEPRPPRKMKREKKANASAAQVTGRVSIAAVAAAVAVGKVGVCSQGWERQMPAGLRSALRHWFLEQDQAAAAV